MYSGTTTSSPFDVDGRFRGYTAPAVKSQQPQPIAVGVFGGGAPASAGRGDLLEELFGTPTTSTPATGTPATGTPVTLMGAAAAAAPVFNDYGAIPAVIPEAGGVAVSYGTPVTYGTPLGAMAGPSPYGTQATGSSPAPVSADPFSTGAFGAASGGRQHAATVGAAVTDAFDFGDDDPFAALKSTDPFDDPFFSSPSPPAASSSDTGAAVDDSVRVRAATEIAAPRRKSKRKSRKSKKIKSQKKPTYPPPEAPTRDSGDDDVKEPEVTKKMKSIDVLPLLKKGVKMNKFKMKGSGAKVRRFFLDKNQSHFCWTPALTGDVTKKPSGGFFSKSSEDRSIPIHGIREIVRNPPHLVQHLSFIPSEQKTMTITIVYDATYKSPEPRVSATASRSRAKTHTVAKSSKPTRLTKAVIKQVNIMAYTAFHYQMVAQTLEKLLADSKLPSVDITNYWEMYLDFEKAVLPKHLRPQKFKWEALAMDASGKESSPESGSGTDIAVPKKMKSDTSDGGGMDTFDVVDTGYAATAATSAVASTVLSAFDF